MLGLANTECTEVDYKLPQIQLDIKRRVSDGVSDIQSTEKSKAGPN